MTFDYHGESSQSSQPVPVTLLELATNVITDWIPGAPASVNRGFVDLLACVLDPYSVGSSSLCVVKSDADRFEKQWKQVTSWVLGVAFCRKVVEMKGYPWWAPVSAFKSREGGASLPMTNFPSELAPSCLVRRPEPPLSTLMPDYVVGRPDPASQFQISFVESKGTRSFLERLSDAPSAWRDQAINAEFVYQGDRCPITQNLVVATRINPSAKRARSRRVYVRAWNRMDATSTVPVPAFRAVLLAHYFGVCERLGFTANARLLSLGTFLQREAFPEGIAQSPSGDAFRARLREEAAQEIVTEKGWLPNEPVIRSPTRSTFPVGNSVLRIGLCEHTLNVLRWLQDGHSSSRGEVLNTFTRRTHELQSLVPDSSHVFVRSDGVVGALRE